MLTRRALCARRLQIERLNSTESTSICQAEVCGHDFRSFTFRAKSPFCPKDLMAALDHIRGLSQASSGLISMGGIAWLATRPNEQVSLSISSPGSPVVVERGPPWWACVPEEEWPDGLAEAIQPLWSETFGDRQVDPTLELAVQVASQIPASASVHYSLQV